MKKGTMVNKRERKKKGLALLYFHFFDLEDYEEIRTYI